MTEKQARSVAALTADGRTLVVTIPFNLRQRGGRKLVMAPDGATPWPPPPSRIDNTLLRALVRAHRWKRMLERGDYATIRDIEKAEGVTNSFVSRLLKLTLLAPDIIEAILDGRQPRALQLESIAYGIPAYWTEQRKIIA